MTYEVDITSSMQCVDVDLVALRQAAIQALHIESIAEAVLSVSLVDNATIHTINLQHLEHDYPTDVISFQLDWTHPDGHSPGNGEAARSARAHIEGEIVVNIEYAQVEAERLGWDLQSELTLYMVHGMLHICGYDDRDPAERQTMRAREAAVFGQLGLPDIPGRDEPESHSACSGEENQE